MRRSVNQWGYLAPFLRELDEAIQAIRMGQIKGAGLLEYLQLRWMRVMLELMGSATLSVAQAAAMLGTIESPVTKKFTIGTTPQIICDSQSNFMVLWVYNNDIIEAKTLWVDFRPDLAPEEAFPVGPGSKEAFGLSPGRILYAVTATGTIEVRVIEFTLC